MSASRGRNRRGVTLIELMIALLIVGLLAGLLLPMVSHARARARRAEVETEIRLLSDAVTRFRERYGVYPPSRIHLREDGQPYALGPVPTRTAQYLSRIWPDYNVTTAVDFDGDGKKGPGVPTRDRLNGSECLVFFLGGMPLPYVPTPRGSSDTLLSIARQSDDTLLFEDVTRRGMEGFCRNPSYPFARSTDVDAQGNPIPGREDRAEVFFDFDPRRLSDVDADGFWEYYPPNLEPAGTGAFDPRVQPHPYVYLSSYEGAGYNIVKSVSGGVNYTHDPAWKMWEDAIGLRWPISRSLIQLNPSDPDRTLDPSFPVSSIQWWNPRSFQIIAPGLDGLIGEGDPTSANPGVAAYDPQKGLSTVTNEMLDDLTNFTNGELAEIE